MSHALTLSPTDHQQDLNHLIRAYLPLVSREIKRLCRSLPYTFESRELQSYGMVGLYEALLRYDPTRAVRFEHYARLRIRGAALDGVRSESWAPTLVHRLRELDEARENLVGQLGRRPTEQDLANSLGIQRSQVAYLQSMANASRTISLDMETTADEDGSPEPLRDRLPAPSSAGPEAEVLRQERVNILAAAISDLTEKERLVITLAFYEELPGHAIARIMRCSAARVSQLQSRALRKLRLQLHSLDHE